MSARADGIAGTGPDNLDERLRRLDRLATLLDAQFGIPGTGIRFGLDGLIGLLPVAGDAAMLAASLYIVIEGRRLGARFTTVIRMLVNVLLDYVVGSIPLAGDVFDIVFRCNQRNLALIRADIEASG